MNTTGKNSYDDLGNYSSLPMGEYDEEDVNGHSKRPIKALDHRLKEQNRNLDVLGESVSRLGELSLNISQEISLQNKMLTNLEVDVESAQEKANTLTAKTTELIKKSGGPRTFCTIVILVFILVILILLVIYT